MQNIMQKFRQSSIVFEKPGILYENLKILTSSFAHVFYLPMSTEGCVGFFKFYLDIELFAKTKEDLVSTHSLFTILLITQDLNKKNPTFCRHY